MVHADRSVTTLEPAVDTPARGDLLLIGVLVAGGLLLQTLASTSGTTSWQAQVVGRPERTQQLDGSRAAVYQICGAIGTATIECDGNNRWRFVRSPCPNQVCVRTGWFAAPVGVPCVPNGIIIEPSRRANDVDGVTR